MSRLFARLLMSPVAVVVVALVTRAVLDKMLALQPDMSLVAYLAQAQSLFDLTAAVALAGIGPGVVVFAARRDTDDAAPVGTAPEGSRRFIGRLGVGRRGCA